MSERTFCDITDEPLSDEGVRNLEDQLEEAKALGKQWFGLCIRNGDAGGLFARLRKAEAERDAERAKVEKLREVLAALTDDTVMTVHRLRDLVAELGRSRNA